MEQRASKLAEYWSEISTKAAYASSAVAGAVGVSLPDISGFLSCAAQAVAVIVPIATYITNLIFKLRREREEMRRVAHKVSDDDDD